MFTAFTNQTYFWKHPDISGGLITWCLQTDSAKQIYIYKCTLNT